MMPLGEFSAIPCGLAHAAEVARARLNSVGHADVYVFRCLLWAKVHRRDGNLTGAFEAVDLAVGWTADGMLKFGSLEAFFRTCGIVDDAGNLIAWEYNRALASKRQYEAERKADWRARQLEGIRHRRAQRKRDLKSGGGLGGRLVGGDAGRPGDVPGTRKKRKTARRGRG